VALPAFATAQLLLSAGNAAIEGYLLLGGPTAPNPQQRSAAGEWDRQTDRRTDTLPLRRPCCSANQAGRANKWLVQCV